MVKKNTKRDLLRHVAIIMDGNGRWAQGRHLPRTAGHSRGVAGVKALVMNCAKLGIKYLTLFAFSTENWRRPVDEVSTLVNLFTLYLDKEIENLAASGVRLKVIGDVTSFPEKLQSLISASELRTVNNQNITLTIAANYGGRWDILNAVRNWQSANPAMQVSELTEELLTKYLSTSEMPEVDLLIRTGGERRISNFLLWQCAYTEFYFTDVLWPDFCVANLNDAIDWFDGRERRYGGVGKPKMKLI